MESHLSQRAQAPVRALDRPWRFAPRGAYDPDKNPTGLISFGTAENQLVLDELREFIDTKVHIPKVALQYAYSTGGGARFPGVLASFLNETFHPFQPLTGANIQVVGAATAMHDVLAWAIGDPGDAILTPKPVYGRFELDFGNKSGLDVVYADTDAASCFDKKDLVKQLEVTLQKSTRRIRAVLIVNPHNPLGRCYPRDTIVAVMRFCQNNCLHFISDEVYGSTVFTLENDKDNASLPGFTSALNIDTADVIDPELCHVTYGFSKDFAVPGLRIGAVVTRSTSVHRAVKSVMRFHNPSGASIAIATAMLEDTDWRRTFLETSRQRIAQAYQHATAGLRELDIPFLPANAGFFVYIDLSAFLSSTNDDNDPEFSLAGRLQEAGVFLHPKEEHGQPGWFRMVYTQDKRAVTEGLRRIESVLHAKKE